MKKCGALGCQAFVKDDQVMCRRHFLGLPKEIRNAIWLSYRAAEFDREAHIALIMEAIRWTAKKEGRINDR
jgi:hypothetical protein